MDCLKILYSFHLTFSTNLRYCSQTPHCTLSVFTSELFPLSVIWNNLPALGISLKFVANLSESDYQLCFELGMVPYRIYQRIFTLPRIKGKPLKTNFIINRKLIIAIQYIHSLAINTDNILNLNNLRWYFVKTTPNLDGIFDMHSVPKCLIVHNWKDINLGYQIFSPLLE